MKKLLLACLLLNSSIGFAQIQIGSREIPSMNIAGKIGKSEMEEFKKSTTVFVLEFKDFDHIEDFQKAITKVWTVTPFKIVKPDEVGNYMQEGYSIFMYGSIIITKGASVVGSRIYDELWLPNVKKNGKIKKKFLARITLNPDADAYMAGSNGYGVLDKKKNGLYYKGHFFNWNAGFLMGYLKTVNDALAIGQERGIFTETTDKVAMQQLKKDTLYIPDYIYLRYNMFTHKYSMVDSKDDEGIEKNYPYPFRVLPAEELSQMILDSNKPIKYLTYISSGTDKFLNVFDSKTGKMIYGNYVSASYFFKSKDMKRIAKIIE